MVRLSALQWIGENNKSKAVAIRECMFCRGIMKTANKDGKNCKLVHNECLSIVYLFKKGKMRSYWQRLASKGFINEFGFPVGRFPRLYSSKITYQRKILMSRRRGLIDG